MGYREIGEIPDCLKEEVQRRLDAQTGFGPIAGFIVNEGNDELLVTYTGITNTLKEQYREQSKESESILTIYRLDESPQGTAKLWKMRNLDDDGELVWERKLR